MICFDCEIFHTRTRPSWRCTDDAPRGEVIVVVRDGDGGAALRVCVLDHELEAAGFGVEGADFAIVPARQDRAAVRGDVDAVALEVGHLDTKELLPGAGVPDADV